MERAGGKKVSMGVRKAAKAAASSFSQWYFSVRTSSRPLGGGEEGGGGGRKGEGEGGRGGGREGGEGGRGGGGEGEEEEGGGEEGRGGGGGGRGEQGVYNRRITNAAIKIVSHIMYIPHHNIIIPRCVYTYQGLRWWMCLSSPLRLKYSLE